MLVNDPNNGRNLQPSTHSPSRLTYKDFCSCKIFNNPSRSEVVLTDQCILVSDALAMLQGQIGGREEPAQCRRDMTSSRDIVEARIGDGCELSGAGQDNLRLRWEGGELP